MPAASSTVRDYNTARESFPSNIFAGIFNFGSREFFEIEEVDRLNPNISLNG